jgi:aminoglycoside 3-N-acetyltransferase I
MSRIHTQPEDEAAIALYSELGMREDVLHFDIPITRTTTKEPE